MPYDNKGRWIPPQEASAWKGPEELVEQLRLTGELERTEYLEDLFDAGKDKWEYQDWETQLNERERFKVLELYKKDYESGRGFADDWGLQFERESGGRDLRLKGLPAQNQYRMLLGDGFDIDYAHYNKNLAYRSTVDKLGEKYGFKDLRTPFSTPRQIRAAKAVLESSNYDWDENWVKNNAMVYTDDEIEALEDFKKFNQTRHFDPKTNITTYLESGDSRSLSTKLYEARAAGNYYQLTEPGAPQWLNVVAGEVPKEAYNSEGTRMIADGDVRAMYQRYLGRDYSKVVDKNLDPSDPTKAKDATAIGKDEIAYWESQAKLNGWTYDDISDKIKGSVEAQRNVDKGRLFYNTNAGKEAEIRKKLVAEPGQLNPPNLTIRQVKVKRPSTIPSNWKVPGV